MLPRKSAHRPLRKSKIPEFRHFGNLHPISIYVWWGACTIITLLVLARADCRRGGGRLVDGKSGIFVAGVCA